jgi:hypothetical protein
MSILLFLAYTCAGATSTSSASADPEVRAAEALERSAAAAERSARSLERATVLLTQKLGVTSTSAAPAPPPTPKGWEGTVGFGLIWLTGNAQSLTFSGNGAIEKKTDHWIFGVKASGVYGQAVVAGSAQGEQVVAMAAGVFLRADRKFSDTISAYVATAAETDHVKSVEIRGTGEAGSGIVWVSEKDGDFDKVLLRTDLGIRYSREQRFQYYPTRMNVPDVDLLAPRLGVAIRYALSKEIIFLDGSEILPNIIGNTRLVVNSLSKLSVKLTDILSFATTFEIKFDSSPAPGKKDTDTALTIGLDFTI